MHNFKYHSVDDLEKLIENLKIEIAALIMWRDMPPQAIWRRRDNLEISRDMLTHAEYELLERTLLQHPN